MVVSMHTVLIYIHVNIHGKINNSEDGMLKVPWAFIYGHIDDIQAQKITYQMKVSAVSMAFRWYLGKHNRNIGGEEKVNGETWLCIYLGLLSLRMKIPVLKEK